MVGQSEFYRTPCWKEGCITFCVLPGATDDMRESLITMFGQIFDEQCIIQSGRALKRRDALPFSERCMKHCIRRHTRKELYGKCVWNRRLPPNFRVTSSFNDMSYMWGEGRGGSLVLHIRTLNNHTRAQSIALMS